MKRFNDYSTVRFGFENCEVLDIPREDFKAMAFNDITENLVSGYNDNGIFDKYKVANDVCIILKKEADKKYSPFGCKEWGTTIFKRLELGDITSISLLNNKNEEVEEFYVNYSGNETNINQNSRINEWGYFEVSIASKGV